MFPFLLKQGSYHCIFQLFFVITLVFFQKVLFVKFTLLLGKPEMKVPRNLFNLSNVAGNEFEFSLQNENLTRNFSRILIINLRFSFIRRALSNCFFYYRYKPNILKNEHPHFCLSIIVNVFILLWHISRVVMYLM